MTPDELGRLREEAGHGVCSDPRKEFGRDYRIITLLDEIERLQDVQVREMTRLGRTNTDLLNAEAEVERLADTEKVLRVTIRELEDENVELNNELGTAVQVLKLERDAALAVTREAIGMAERYATALAQISSALKQDNPAAVFRARLVIAGLDDARTTGATS